MCGLLEKGLHLGAAPAAEGHVVGRHQLEGCGGPRTVAQVGRREGEAATAVVGHEAQEDGVSFSGLAGAQDHRKGPLAPGEDAVVVEQLKQERRARREAAGQAREEGPDLGLLAEVGQRIATQIAAP